jgi:hypothetical protein
MRQPPKHVTSDPDRAPRRGRGVTSDPDPGLAVNSGTDPQRPGEVAKPRPDPASGTAPAEGATDRFGSTHRPAASGPNEDVEGTKSDPDDAL